jgi:hypothetical protein
MQVTAVAARLARTRAQEDSMSKSAASAYTVADVLARARDWWQRHNELGNFDRVEMDRIAHEFGMTARELQDMVARGPQAAHLLYERLAALGIAKYDLERTAHGLVRELERTCSGCPDKAACRKDLELRPDDAGWKEYCPNSLELDAVLQSLKDATGRK